MAAQFFQARHFQILHRRLRTRFFELDLVVLDPQGHLHFVEVKTLSSAARRIISVHQAQRLKRSMQDHLRKTGRMPRAHLALVIDRDVQVIWDFLRDC